ncbi:MAG: hypothetical protein PHQ83_12580, partial [Eubacteriales bacterium]|nr:hypothetical protein [Eubacteriales bacterium]
MWRSILRIGMVLALSVLLAFGIERFFFNRFAFSGSSGPDESIQPFVTRSAETLYPASQGFALENGRLRSIADQATIELAIPGGKIRQVILSYQSATDADIYIRIAGSTLASKSGDSAPEADRLIADKAPHDLDQAATVVDAAVDQVTLVVPDAGFILDAVTLDRSVAIHPQRLILLAAGLFLFGLLLNGSLPFFATPTRWFLLLGASLGALMIILSPLGLLGWDEQIHFKSMLVRSFPDVAWLTPATQRLTELDLPSVNTRFDQQQATDWLAKMDESS